MQACASLGADGCGRCYVHRYCTFQPSSSAYTSHVRRTVTASNDDVNYVVSDSSAAIPAASCTPANADIWSSVALSSHCPPAKLSCAGKSHPYLQEGTVVETHRPKATHSGTGHRIPWSLPAHSGPGGYFSDYSAHVDRSGRPLEEFAHNQRFCSSHMDGVYFAHLMLSYVS